MELIRLISSFLVLLLITVGSCAATNHNKRVRKPCKRLVFYFHDIIYNGHNYENATSVIVGAPAWGNRTVLADHNHFGDVVVFDDPITLDNNLHSPPVGRARGLYIYDTKDTLASWETFSFVFNSTQHKGTINFLGADQDSQYTRDISVIGGTGDFFMARGIATVSTGSLELDDYFSIRVDIKLYECW